jgi:hypothetical protein
MAVLTSVIVISYDTEHYPSSCYLIIPEQESVITLINVTMCFYHTLQRSHAYMHHRCTVKTTAKHVSPPKWNNVTTQGFVDVIIAYLFALVMSLKYTSQLMVFGNICWANALMPCYCYHLLQESDTVKRCDWVFYPKTWILLNTIRVLGIHGVRTCLYVIKQ